jgi:type II secretory pathway pseudopilin PulG
MLFTILVVLMLLAILASLGMGLVSLIRDRGQTNRTVKALTWRIALSLALFFLLILGFALGLIQPHPPGF